MKETLNNIKLRAVNLTKKFDRRIIFESVNFELVPGSSIAITGRNGSGKSTLIKIIARLLSQSSGELNILENDKLIRTDQFYKYIGFVSPYLNLYDEFTGYENLKIISDIRSSGHDNIDKVLEQVGLYPRRNDLVKIYSSGMKQRLKIAFSILHEPDVLLFDEPTSNLDLEGVAVVDNIASEYGKNRILVIATNDEHEKSLCTNELNLNRNV